MGRDEYSERLQLYRITIYLMLDRLEIGNVFWCSVHHGFGDSPLCESYRGLCLIHREQVKVAKSLLLSDLEGGE